MSCRFDNLSLWWVVASMSCHFDKLSLRWVVASISCCFDELLLWWVVALMSCPFDELSLWWVVTLMSCCFDELSLWWVVTLMSCCFDGLLSHHICDHSVYVSLVMFNQMSKYFDTNSFNSAFMHTIFMPNFAFEHNSIWPSKLLK